MLQDTQRRYLPQDEICFICSKRIGDHIDYDLWKCLEKSSFKLREVRNTIGRASN